MDRKYELSIFHLDDARRLSLLLHGLKIRSDLLLDLWRSEGLDVVVDVRLAAGEEPLHEVLPE